MLSNLEALAKNIHEDYIKTRKQRNEPILVPEKFEDLSIEQRYDNIRQAKNIARKLTALGYAMVPAAADGTPVEQLSAGEIEAFAMLEHDDWMAGKLRNGWVYAQKRDDKHKHHNCLVPYDELSFEDKEKDRDVARNAIARIRSAGMKVIRPD